MNQEVTAYINNLNQAWQADLCTSMRQIIHTTIPEVEERIQYGKPHFLRNGKYAYVIAAAKEWVSLTIFNAKTLEAPEGFFEPGGSPDRKTIKIRKGQEIDAALVATLLQQAASSSA